MRDIESLADLWARRVEDPELARDLAGMRRKSSEDLADAFYRDLSFGTAGLRGILGVGTNRMNVYTVGRATQGLARYLNERFDAPSVAIARDSRNGGEAFVRRIAGMGAGAGLHRHHLMHRAGNGPFQGSRPLRSRLHGAQCAFRPKTRADPAGFARIL